jgi:hypothetical protein
MYGVLSDASNTERIYEVTDLGVSGLGIGIDMVVDAVNQT